MYGMDAYLMIMHEIEKARLARQARKVHQKGDFPNREPAVRDGQVHRPTKSKEVTTCP